jgi:hypothetical protein
MFSSFNAIMGVSGGNVGSADFVVTGVPIGWGWSEGGSSINGSAGCTWGTITWGLSIGNLTIGFIQAYHFSWSLNVNTCTLTWSQGSGFC